MGGEMATAEFAVQPLRPRRRPRPVRKFFLGMTALAVAIVLFGFVPEILRFAAGTFPIPWILHVHAACMTIWVASFGTQAWLGATGRTRLHRQFGPYAVASGWLAFASMVFVEMRTYLAHPKWLTPNDLDWKLPGLFIYLTFAVFLTWATIERRRPQWHKRLMTCALFLSLDAAIQRFVWIPMDYGFGPFMAVLDLFLIVPLLAYDWRTLGGRVHPATLRAMGVLFAAEAALLAAWGTEAWHHAALAIGKVVVAAF
jgi:hypothetical protein